MISITFTLYLASALAIFKPSSSQQLDTVSDQIKTINTFASVLSKLSEKTTSKSSSVECMVFGDSACQYICDLKCILYGCVSAGICHENVCDCRESYRIGDEYVSSNFFKFVPPVELWKYRFDDNAASLFVATLIIQDAKTTQAVTSLLQDPHITGVQIANKLAHMFPTARWMLSALKPIVRGKIDMFVDKNRHFDYPTFTFYLNEYAKARYKDIEQMSIKEHTGLDEFLQKQENIVYMARQLLLFPSKHMQAVMETFTAVTGIAYNQVTNLTQIDLYTNKDPSHQLTSEQIDEIIQAGAFSQLLEIHTMANEEHGSTTES